MTSVADSGAGTLRDQITLATAGDTIEFSTRGTITLTSGQLVIGKDLIIKGPGANLLTVSGNNISRVFYIPSGIVALSGLTISDGNVSSEYGGGGGIYNGHWATLAVSDCTIFDNNSATNGGGIENYGRLTVTDSTISGNSAQTHHRGGGIYNARTATLSNCTFSGNSANEGGGVYISSGTITFSHSTFSGNSANMGGGIYLNSGTATISHSTFSGNSVIHRTGGGGIYISVNFDDPTLNLTHSIVAGNSVADTSWSIVAPDISGIVISGGHNLVGNRGGSSGLSDMRDMTGTTTAPLDPKLGSLADNGGPTATMALGAGSPAINAGDLNFDGTGKTDQRGESFARVKSGRIDIGALEANNTTPATTDITFSGTIGSAFSGQLTATDADTGNSLSYAITSGTLPAGLSLDPATGEITGTPTVIAEGTTVKFTATDNHGATSNEATAIFDITEARSLIVTTGEDSLIAFDSLTSLREAIAFANSNPDTSTVEFAPAVRGTITLTRGLLSIYKNLTISGPGASALTVSGSAAAPVYNRGVFDISSGAVVTLSGLTISGGSMSNGGGIVNHGGILTVSNSTISGNTATNGGGIVNHGGTLTVSNSRIFGNTGYSSGGGIYNASGATFTVSNSTVSGNTATDGGGIYNASGATLTVSSSTLWGNTTDGYGGGISNYGSLTVSSSTLSSNTAANGGGIYNHYRGSLTISNSTLSGNTAIYGGGGIFNHDDLTIWSSIVAGNSATQSAPEIWGTVISGGYNLVSKSDGSTGLTATGDQTGTIVAPLDANLDSLKSNGGPTQTMALLAGSPAINAGDPTFDGTGKIDQRGAGFARVKAGRVDIGAFEVQSAIPVSTGPSSFVATQNVAKTVTLTATDADGDALTYIITSLPTRGTLYDGPDTTKSISTVPYTLTGSSHQVTLLSKSLGTGTFGFVVNDGTSSSTPQFVMYSVDDVTAPTGVAVTTPPNGAILKTLASIGGTAEDDTGGSGIATVKAYLRRFKAGMTTYEYWAKRSGVWGWGDSVSGFETTLDADDTWNVDNTSPSSTQLPEGASFLTGSYQFYAQAFDNAGNGKTSAINKVTVDTSAPASVEVTTPALNSTIKGLTSISGTAADGTGGSGIARVVAYLRRFKTGSTTTYEYWAKHNGTWGWGDSNAGFDTVFSGGKWAVFTNSPSGTQLPSGVNLPTGSYQFYAYAYDKAATFRISRINKVTVDNVVPSKVVVTSPGKNATISTLTVIKGIATDTTGGSGISRVDVFLRRGPSSAYQYWARRNGVWGWGTSVTAIATTFSAGDWRVDNTTPSGSLLPSGSTNLPSGTYQVFAKAYDKALNATISDIHSLTVVTGGSEAMGEEPIMETEPTATPVPPPGAVESPVVLSSASAQESSGTIRLVFSGAVGKDAAADPARYSVSINGVTVTIESVQVLSSTTLVLTLEEGILKAGNALDIAYNIKDSKGRTMEGQAKVTAQ